MRVRSRAGVAEPLRAVLLLVGLTVVARAVAAPPPLTDEQVRAFAEVTGERAATPLPASALGEPAVNSSCTLQGAGGARATSAECLTCHPRRRTHPIDFRYAPFETHSPRYASPDEVVRAGVLLPDGELRCVTCHSGSSPWRFRIALPPGATPRPSVRTQTREQLEAGVEAQPDPPLQPGAEVSPTPLCRACHLF